MIASEHASLPTGYDPSTTSMEVRDFHRLRDLIHRETGIWLRDGKQVMLASRLSRRLRELGLASFAEYYAFIEHADDGGDELGELINCVTTNKTSFFREKHHFDFLAESLVPQLRQAALHGRPKRMRVWSAASSTGQEPYSIAITLLEALGGSCAGWTIEVIASDIDTNVLATAARAVYDETSIEDVDPSLRGKYFLRGKSDSDMAGQVRVKSHVARLVEFKRINLMDAVWPIEGRFEAIFFRNALIYFDKRTQEAFLRRLVRYLEPRGHLFLGHSEHVPWLHDVVAPLSKTIYRLRESAQ